MTVSIFPNTSGDVVLDLRDHADGGVSLVVVEPSGAIKDFGEVMRVVDGGGQVVAHTKIIRAESGFAPDETQHFAPYPG